MQGHARVSLWERKLVSGGRHRARPERKNGTAIKRRFQISGGHKNAPVHDK